jgi:ElaB/YqjD/DUF883 family membrane-anchored ribosome-binding protein
METTGVKNVKSEVKKAAKHVATDAKEERVALQERVADVRDLVEDIRERAELAIEEHPYLLPVATGVLGLGVGILIGSKLSRIMLLTAAGALMSDKVREQIARVSRDVIHEFGSKFGDAEGDVEDLEDVDQAERSVT